MLNLRLLQTDKTNTIPIFNELAVDYWLTDYLSFGFTSYIRHKSMQLLNPQPGEIICDAMCGIGNNFKVLTQNDCRIIAIDNAPKMIDLIIEHNFSNQIIIRHENFLENTLEEKSIDKLICTFGIKCLNESDYQLFVHQLKRIIKPGGTFVLSDIFLKNSTLIRLPILFYIKHIVPLLNYIFTRRNPHRYLYPFASKSINLQLFCRLLEQEIMPFHIKTVGLKQGIILYGKNS